VTGVKLVVDLLTLGPDPFYENKAGKMPAILKQCWQDANITNNKAGRMPAVQNITF
jgi:hypothetical protein